MKKMIALLLALVMVLGLAACSVEQAPAPTEAPKAEAPKEEAPKAEEPAAPAEPEAPAAFSHSPETKSFQASNFINSSLKNTYFIITI